jgi:hypothetical protein
MSKLSLENGKYIIESEGGFCVAKRYGDAWRDLTGDKLFGAMMSEVERLEKQHTEDVALLREVISPMRLSYNQHDLNTRIRARLEKE